MPAKTTKAKIADVVQVERHGEKIIIPESLTWDRLIDFAQRQKEYEQQAVRIFAPIEGLPFEGAYALFCELEERFGYANSTTTTRQTLLGDVEDPPHTLSIPVSKTETVQVPWGSFSIPGVDGKLESTLARSNEGRAQFVIGGQVLRKHEGIVNEVVEGVRRRVRENSLWRGKAWRFRLHDDDGEPYPFPMPEFLDLPAEAERELTFSEEVAASFRVNLWNQIDHRESMKAVGFPTKRGILLAGPYGTGKSMAATVTAIKAVRNGFTFIEVDKANELGDVVRIARDYQPAVVFCEDIDRVMNGERTIAMDELLNIIDGVEAKGTEIVIVLTTNDVDAIHPSMLRPGRLDAIINVAPPDAAAVARLMRVYARGLIDDDTDLSTASAMLDGEKTAVVREVVERSKSAWVDNHPDGDPQTMRITDQDLVDAAHSMRNQLDLLKDKATDERSDQEKAAAVLADAIVKTAPVQNGMAVASEAIVTEAIE